MKEHIDMITSPSVAVPATTAAMFASFMDILPAIMQIGSFIYLVLLITHKLWTMWKEWKKKDESTE